MIIGLKKEQLSAREHSALCGTLKDFGLGFKNNGNS